MKLWVKSIARLTMLALLKLRGISFAVNAPRFLITQSSAVNVVRKNVNATARTAISTAISYKCANVFVQSCATQGRE